MGRRCIPSLMDEECSPKDGEVSEAHCPVCIPLTTIFNILSDCWWRLLRLSLSLGLLGCLMPFRGGLSVVLSFYMGVGSGGGRPKNFLARPFWSLIRMTGHGRFSPV